jgi:hypothetical protein
MALNKIASFLNYYLTFLCISYWEAIIRKVQVEWVILKLKMKLLPKHMLMIMSSLKKFWKEIKLKKGSQRIYSAIEKTAHSKKKFL